jgi:hypothetical protein
MTLGRATAIDAGEARRWATQLYARVKLGQDPFTERKAKPPAAMALKAMASHYQRQRLIGKKCLQFIEQKIGPTCFLYRHYHPNGDLLYVGVSLDALKRQIEHAKDSPWRGMICLILIEPFESREAALEAEQVAIRTEFPKFNVIHNDHRQHFRGFLKKISP